jgi:hypothetical protein
MELYFSEDFIKRVRDYLGKNEPFATVEAFIEDAVDSRIENYPWVMGDICVHNGQCMHWKSVEGWKKEGGIPF